MPRPSPIAPLLCFALSLCACGTDTHLQSGVLDAGRDARVDDAASPDGSQAQGDGSADHDADVTKEPCNAAYKGATPHCDVATDTCVACTGDQHCEGDPNNSRCVQGACVPCETNEHCQGITNGSVALGVCDQGACVECTGHDYAACGTDEMNRPRVCDSVNRSCSEQLVGSVGLCQPCVSDAACTPGRRCVFQDFKGAQVGSFCLWEQGAAPGNCGNARPFVWPRAAIPSVDGHAATYCWLATTTCPAYHDFKDVKKDTCDEGNQNDSACGVDGLSDGLCRVFTSGTPNIYRCTTPCSSDDDCELNYACTENEGKKACNLQPSP